MSRNHLSKIEKNARLRTKSGKFTKFLLKDFPQMISEISESKQNKKQRGRPCLPKINA
jgi:hypothetical protein